VVVDSSTPVGEGLADDRSAISAPEPGVSAAMPLATMKMASPAASLPRRP
jgi:hypothetical protein